LLGIQSISINPYEDLALGQKRLTGANTGEVMGTIINPITGVPYKEISRDLIIETSVIKTERRRNVEDIIFQCPACKARNRQNTLQAKSFPEPHVGVWKCNRCFRMIHVRKNVVGQVKPEHVPNFSDKVN
jgi:hypothetical protein